MNKKAGFFSGLFILILLAILGYSGYYLYENFPREQIQLKNINIPEITVENSVPSKQFYERMRYADRTINYYISETCSENKTDYMLEAMDILEIKTMLKFNPVSKPNSVLNILCEDISPQADEENHFIAGEGGPSRVLNSTLYSVILEGKVALYRESSCNNANVALHELLHALGFDHNNNKKSILYPTLECDQKMDQEIIDSINKLYRVDSRADLVFAAATASKSGRYLNFHIEILNQGLQPSIGVGLGIYADNEFVESFELNEIQIGAKKILDVENLKVPLNAKSIEFVADYENEILEIDENNNRATLNSV